MTKWEAIKSIERELHYWGYTYSFKHKLWYRWHQLRLLFKPQRKSKVNAMLKEAKRRKKHESVQM